MNKQSKIKMSGGRDCKALTAFGDFKSPSANLLEGILPYQKWSSFETSLSSSFSSRVPTFSSPIPSNPNLHTFSQSLHTFPEILYKISGILFKEPLKVYKISGNLYKISGILYKNSGNLHKNSKILYKISGKVCKDCEKVCMSVFMVNNDPKNAIRNLEQVENDINNDDTFESLVSLLDQENQDIFNSIEQEFI